MTSARDFDKGGLAVSAGAIALGLYVLWEAQSFSPLGSVFPRFVAILLLLAATALGTAVISRRQRPAKPGGGSNGRRAALALALVAWVALVPVLGFPGASLLGFVAVGAVAKYDAWSIRGWSAFGVAALVAVAFFCFVFSAFLNVPLPGGLLER
jgi:hypothetical protein